MAARFLKHLDVAAIAALEDHARHPARTGLDLVAWLAARGVVVPQATVYDWLQQFRAAEIARLSARLHEPEPPERTPQDVAAQTAAVRQLTERSRTLGEARMLRDDDELTPEIHDEVAARFRAIVTALKRSDTWAARSLDMSPSVLSQILSRTYKGDTEQYVRRIDKWIDVQHGKLKAPKPTEYVKTTTAQAIIGAAKIAIDENRIAVVYGPSGVGKTLTARYLASEQPGAIYVEVTEGNKRPTALLDALARAAGPSFPKLSVGQLERHVVELLKGTERLILVDEMHTLVTGRSKEEQSLNMLRRIQDQTGCPMVWFGTAELNTYLEQGVGIRQGVDQIYGRVVFWLDLATPVLANEDGPGRHTIEDIRKIVGRYEMRVTPDAEQFLRDISNTPGLGSMRAVTTLLNLLLRRANGREVTAELLRDAQHQRLGRAAAIRAERRVETFKIARAG